MSEERRPIRIVRIIARLNIGGPAIHAMLLTQQLQPPRYESVLVAGLPEPGEGDMSDGMAGAPARKVVVPWLRQRIGLHDVVAWWHLFRIVRREKPDIVHTHTAKAGALGRTAALASNWLERLKARLTRRPATTCRIVHTFHGHVLDGYFAPWLSRVFVAIERWLARRTDCLIAVSRTVRDELLKKEIGRPDQWRVVPLGLDLSALAELPLPHEHSQTRIGLVGRLVPIKNPSLFIDALHHARRRPAGRALTGWIVGDGPLRQSLEAQVRRLGLEHLVRFMGWQRDLRHVYEGLEATCLTSWNEGTPVALIEAMAAGRVVIAADVGGVRELLQSDGEATSSELPTGTFRAAERGILVRAGDAEGFAAALATVAEDSGLRRRLGGAARAYVTQRFSVGRLIQDITLLYEDLQTGRCP